MFLSEYRIAVIFEMWVRVQCTLFPAYISALGIQVLFALYDI